MRITDYEFELPEDLIAQKPLENRESSRMLAVNRSEKSWSDAGFNEFPRFLRETDVLVLNNTKVFPARLFGETETGANIEIFLVKETENQIWEALARPAKRLKIGKKINFNENLTAEVVGKSDEGRVFIRFYAKGNFHEILDQIGKTPLPPYIKRGEGGLDEDRERYQTVFAKERGAIAAPTAGLHFTPQILEDIKNKGVAVTEITLHVGYGTFEPVRVSDLSEHKVLPENYEISEQAAETLNRAKAENRRIIAVGTTTTRALESAIEKDKRFTAGKSAAGLTITPNYEFRAIDGLLTNFHLPQSSLLVLISTFGGYELIMKAYRHAVKSRYRFYSYGDCMLVI
ncbi:MAG: S-adenosylmethionine:tRNA ribosyltransferase-isomerase [Acidobacteria bacterium]|jgi:S-adenosylmethionine:tRNA ribosyltransferase-isomerase|nr:S-adenosylmethionine:tRNA ribosyltransferase-isomerase [Acidobacteriota bacterium]